MPVSYFPPLPQNIWGNIEGDIDNQTDLDTKIETKIIQKKNNLIINPEYEINQRGSNILNIVSRERTSNIATVETEYPHGFESGDNVQISNLSTSDYNKPSGVNISVISNTKFNYSATGSDESITLDSGKCILLNRISRTLNNGDFLADRWMVNTESDGQLISTYSNGIEIVNNTGEKFALIQAIPNELHEPVLNGKYTAAFSAFSNSSAKVRLEILKWDGPEDNINRDIVNAWNADGNRPTLSSNWSYLTNQNLNSVTGGVQQFTQSDIKLNTVCKNIAIMIVIEELASGDYINISKVQLYNNSELVPYSKPDVYTELQKCRLFFQKSNNMNESPGTLDSDSRVIIPTSFGVSNGNSAGVIDLDFMYKTPNVTLYPTGNNLNVNTWKMSIGTYADILAGNITREKFNLINDSGFSVSTSFIEGHYTADAEI